MNTVEMAVIVSEEDDEAEKFQKQGLDITGHRQKMNALTPEGLDIEDRFKDPGDPLQLVFVCAMWLTGFDVENLSTLCLRHVADRLRRGEPFHPVSGQAHEGAHPDAGHRPGEPDL